jgi:peptidoglycan/xylan/chitin deacetylase (PgdA/CDA1 family)
MIKDKKRIPPKTVAVTFDDGMRNNYIYALPILAKYKIPASIFVITDYINQGEYLTADQIKLMSDMGVDIGSHTLSHLWLTNVDDEARWKSEIAGSKKVLEQLLGKEVKSFCYPGGSFNEKIKNIVKETGYKVAVTTSPGWKFPKDDIFALKRIRISNTSDNLLVFWFKLTGSYLFIKEMRDDY